MKTIRILVLGLILLVAFSSQALADGGTKYEVKEVDGYKVGLAFAGGMAQMGHNSVSVQINDTKGKPVANAKVSITAGLYQDAASSSSSGGMNMNMGNGSGTATGANEKPMLTTMADMTAGQQTGEYHGELTLDEAGHWMITVNSVINNQEKSAEFTQELSKSGPNLLVLGAIAAVLIVIIAAVAITRRRSVKKALPETAK